MKEEEGETSQDIRRVSQYMCPQQWQNLQVLGVFTPQAVQRM